MTNSKIEMYTDGASRGNPGRGGYGVILINRNLQKELSQGYRLTTNNRMELMAVIAGLEALKKEGLTITVYSDSQYVVKAVMEGWLQNWIANNFKGGKKQGPLDALLRACKKTFYSFYLGKRPCRKLFQQSL